MLLLFFSSWNWYLPFKLNYETVCLDRQTYVSKIPFWFVSVLNFTHKSCIGDKIQSKHCIKSTLIDLINILNYYWPSLLFHRRSSALGSVDYYYFHIIFFLHFLLKSESVDCYLCHICLYFKHRRDLCETWNSIEYEREKTSQISFCQFNLKRI